MRSLVTAPVRLWLTAGVFNVVVVPVLSASIAWKNDFIVISVAESGNFTLDLQASRYVLPSASGHFKLSVTRGGVGFNTSCVSFGASATTLSEALDNTDPVSDLGGATVVREGNGSSAYNYGYIYYISAVNTTESLGATLDIAVVGSGVDYGCARISTMGYWDDSVNWDTGVVPGSADEVAVPTDTGFVFLSQDTTVSTLSMSGGALVLHDTTCLPGWISAPGGTSASFGTSSRGGALRGTLVTVQGLEENQWVGRLCRGDPLDRDCWIGMSTVDAGDDSSEAMEWDDDDTVLGDFRYRSWTRHEPDDLQVNERNQTCAAMYAPEKRASHQGEARWYDAECDSAKPFVCQAFGITTSFQLTVTTVVTLLGGYLFGAGAVLSSTYAQVSGADGEVGLLHGATLINSASGVVDWSAPLAIGWGGTIQNKGTLTFADSVSLEGSDDAAGFVVGAAGEEAGVVWPVLANEENGEIIVASNAEVDLRWLLWNQGGKLLVNGALVSSGGGYSFFGSITIASAAEAKFSNSSFAMHQTESVAVTLQADREVLAQDVEDSSAFGGYYRLTFAGSETKCIGYHASALKVQEALEEVHSVQDVGGVDVRRDGDGQLETWHYGYRHVLTFDGARNISSSALALSCAGSANSCGCVDVTGLIAGRGGSRVGCGTAIFGSENASTSAEFQHTDCRIQASITVEGIRQGGETTVSGGGALVLSNGGHHILSSDTGADVKVELDAEAVCTKWSANITGSVNVTSGGVFWFAGGDWDALDAVRLLHASPETLGRTAAAIASPPNFNVTIAGDVTVENGGEIRLAAVSSSTSTVTVMGSLTLAGGGLSGRGRTDVQGSTAIISHGTLYDSNGSDEEASSSLKNGVTLEMSGGGEWSGGNCYARDGATVVNDGMFHVTTDDEDVVFGAGGIFGAEPTLDFDGVGWYPNPLCGDSCTTEPQWKNLLGGSVIGSATANAKLCFVLHNEGTVLVENGGVLDWCGAGEGGGAGNIHLPGVNSTLKISAGAFLLNATANVSGNGVLHYSGGQGHKLADVMMPSVVLSGDAGVVYGGEELVLGKGLVVMDKATVNFSSTASSNTIFGDLFLHDSGTIMFPFATVENSLLSPLGLGVPPIWGEGEGQLDGGNGWGGASRSSVRAEGTFMWTGGTFTGNARIITAGDSEWHQSINNSGERCSKRLKDTFHLVNEGNAVWSTGDIIVSTGAAFVNRGTLRLLEESDNSSNNFTSAYYGVGNAYASSISSQKILDISQGVSPRIRGLRKGDRDWMMTESGGGDYRGVSAGGAGSVGGTADWAWEELSYDGY